MLISRSRFIAEGARLAAIAPIERISADRRVFPISAPPTGWTREDDGLVYKVAVTISNEPMVKMGYWVSDVLVFQAATQLIVTDFDSETVLQQWRDAAPLRELIAMPWRKMSCEQN